ncbi:MAG: hypothetical protein ACYTDY_08540 [Planctomycetota bacterium]|jgi:methyl-accepting chemotaxis protein
MAAQRYRRRKWLIDTDIQVRLGVKLAFYVGVYLALFCLVALFEPLLVLLKGGIDSVTAREEIATILGAILLPLLLAVACMFVHGILILHRVAGPVYRIRRGLEALADGRLDEVMRLRQKDYLKDVAILYNDAAGQLRMDVEDARHETKAILEATSEDQVREHAQRLSEILGAYRVGTEDETDDADEVAQEATEAAQAS